MECVQERNVAGESGIYVRQPASYKYVERISTLYENFNQGLAKARDKHCLGVRDFQTNSYRWITYGQVDTMRCHLGSFLHDKFTHHSHTYKCVGIYTKNRPEWTVTEQACNAYSLVLVPLYDTLGPDSLRFIVNHAEIEVLVCSYDRIGNVFAILHQAPSLHTIVCIDVELASMDLIHSVCKSHQIQFFAWPDALRFGALHTTPHVPPTADSLATICYTSGTTGIPKGALLTHRNLSSPSDGLVQSGIPIFTSDIHISYLPLAHVYERAVVTVTLGSGASVGFYSGDVNRLIDDIQLLRPTLFFSVPRLFNKIYSKIIQNTVEAGGIKGYLSRRCFKTKLENRAKYGKVTHPIWDPLVCNKIKQTLGGRIRKMLSGSAPIEPTVVSFLSVAFCCYMFEGYGSTETCCFGALTFDNDYSVGHIGGPPYGCQLKLVDIPEMGYLTSDKTGPKGEICLRGPSIFKGYYKDELLTAEVLTGDGWFYTGDVGHIREDGKLSLIDRKKNIFKLSQGEYVAPEKLENIYSANSPFVHQLFVYGDSLKSFLVAIVVLDPDTRKEVGSISKNAVMQDLERIARSNNLNSFEYIRNIHLETEPFTIENDLITPTLKLKRNVIQEKYKNILNALYTNSSKL